MSAKKVWRSSGIFFAILLGACANTFGNRSSVSLFTPASVAENEGVIIFSAGAPDGCFTTLIALDIRKDISSKKSKSIALVEATSYQVKSDFTTHQGFLHAMKLPAGDYFFYPYVYGWTVDSAYRANFTVVPNETTYLGEYYFTRKCGTEYVVNDNFERDLSRTKELNPAIDTSLIKKRLMALEDQPS